MKAILVGAAIVSLAAAGLWATGLCTAKQDAVKQQASTAERSSLPESGLRAFVDKDGNLISPTDEQMAEEAARSPISEPAEGIVVDIDPNDPSKGQMLVNPPQSFMAARIGKDGKLESECFATKEEADTFIAGGAAKPAPSTTKGAK